MVIGVIIAVVMIWIVVEATQKGDALIAKRANTGTSGHHLAAHAQGEFAATEIELPRIFDLTVFRVKFYSGSDRSR
jgi:hypothetical protein